MKDVFGFLMLLVIFALAAWAYIAPTLIAHKRKHRNRLPIAVLNIGLGWTFLGWLAALVWAFTRDTEDATVAAAVVVPAGDGEATRTCPMCAEVVKAAAVKCKHCGADLPALPA